MILGLTALGEGSMPTRIRVRASVGHLLGGVLGGAAVAAVLWLLASPFRTLAPSFIPALIVGAVALMALAIDTGQVRERPGRQVPAVWFGRYGPSRSYAMYGLMFGSTFATLRPFAVIYPVFAGIAMLVPLPAALLSGALFGAGRTATIGFASLRATAISGILYRRPGMRRIWVGASVLLTLCLLGMAMGGMGEPQI